MSDQQSRMAQQEDEAWDSAGTLVLFLVFAIVAVLVGGAWIIGRH